MNISVVGDSISTYLGYIPSGYALYYDKPTAEKNGILSVYDMWWEQVQQALNCGFLVNNSFSGSTVSGLEFPCAPSRAAALGAYGLSPDVVLIYIGVNDFARGLPVDDGTGYCFAAGYDALLRRIRQNYPSARIFCGTLMKSVIRDQKEWKFPDRMAGESIDTYNRAIRQVCLNNKCCLADLADLGRYYETLDGTHPTVNGQYTLASAWLKCLEKAGLKSGPARFRIQRDYLHSGRDERLELLKVYRGDTLVAKMKQSHPLDHICSNIKYSAGIFFHKICTDIIIFNTYKEEFGREPEISRFGIADQKVTLDIGVERALADGFGKLYIADETYHYQFHPKWRRERMDIPREIRQNMLLVTEHYESFTNRSIEIPLARTVQVDIQELNIPYENEEDTVYIGSNRSKSWQIEKREILEVDIYRTVPTTLNAALLFLQIFDFW